MNSATITISILLCAINSFTYINSQTLHNFSKNDYLAASQNWSVKCDKSDYVYFGNNSGLLQFDGVSWRLFPSVNGSIVRTVAHDSTKIYTGGYREIGYWERNRKGIYNYQSLTEDIKEQLETNEEFWNIFIKDEQIVFHSFAGIYIFENNKFTILKPGGFINFTTQVNGEIYVAIHGEGLFRLSNKQLVLISDAAFIKDKYLRFIAKDPNNDNYFIGTESKGLFTYNSNTQEIKPVAAHLQDFFIKNKINHGLVTPEGDIIIGTILNGIIGFTPDGLIKFNYNNDNGLQSNTVLGMATDGFNNIWLALDKGIDLVTLEDDNAYRQYYDEEVGAVYSASLFKGHLYLGTNQGLYVKKWEDHQPFKLVENTQGQVWDCSLIDNSLFIGLNSGTIVNENNAFKTLSNFAGAYTIKPHPFYQDVLIQGTYNELIVYRKMNQKWLVSNTIKGFNNLTRLIEFDHQGNLWATHFYGGLYKIRLNDDLTAVESVDHYDKIDDSEAINRGFIRAFKIENQIVITSGYKLYTYDDLNNKIVPYTMLNGAIGEYKKALRIIPGTNHHYWLISSEGMAYYKIYADDIRLVREYPNSIFENHLIPSHENLKQLDDTTTLVCLENGYTLLNLNQSSSSVVTQFQPKLQEVYALNRKADKIQLQLSAEEIELPHSQNSLYLRYSFPIINAEPFKYQYKVEGLTENWSDKMDKPIIELTRIPAGEYTIGIKAVNNWNKESQIFNIHLKIQVPWYQSSIAIICYLLLTIGLIVALKHITTRKINLREKRKREEKEKELIQLKNEKLNAELSYKSQKLASSAMGIIKKNEFLLALKSKLKKQKDILGNRYPDKYYQEVMNKIDSNISGQDDWQLFEANFEQAHETFLKTMKSTYSDLTPSDLRLCAYLRINLSSKDIAPLLGISVRGVENHRYRLRKKLGLTAEDNLTEFIIDF
jgi:DNA-binding CsgD family transcriptional regulator